MKNIKSKILNILREVAEVYIDSFKATLIFMLLILAALMIFSLVLVLAAPILLSSALDNYYYLFLYLICLPLSIKMFKGIIKFVDLIDK